MLGRLFQHWVYGGFLAGLALLVLFPLVAADWPEPLRLTFLFLPIYMLHQYEEHDGDRFRRSFNETIGKGREVLTPAAVFIVNVPGVWGVIIAACYLTAKINPGLGLIAVYLAVVNAVAHAGQAIARRAYNPGLITALVVFLPVGAYTLVRFDALGAGGFVWQCVGLGVAVVIHAVIMVYATARRRALVKRWDPCGSRTVSPDSRGGRAP